MSFNKNNPNAMGKIMGYLRQISGDMGGTEQQRRSGQGDEERLYRARGPKYARVPSKASLSASTTCTSLATSCGSQATLAPNTYAAIPENTTTDSEEDEQETFEKTRLHFQQLRQISLGNEYKYKMEMEIKSAKDENLRNSVPFVKQLSGTSDKSVKEDYTINGDSTPYNATTQPIYFASQLLAALTVSMGSLVVGMTTGYTSPALATMIHANSTIEATPEHGSWVGGMMPLAALVGAISGGPLIQYLGRRNTLLFISVPFIIAWILIASAVNIAMVFAGRALGGFCVGVGSLTFPVYLAEALQPEVRGTLGLFPTAFGNIGILVCSVAGTYLNWSELAYLGAALPVPFLLLTLLIPETPHWHMSKSNYKGAKDSLQWLRGKNSNIEKEFSQLTIQGMSGMSQGGFSLKQLFVGPYKRAVMTCLGLMFCQQMSGINAVIFYTVQIFETSGSSINENVCAIMTTAVNFASTFIATVLIDRLGRKILLYISSVTMIVTMFTAGTFFVLKDNFEANVSGFEWLPLASLMIFVLGFSVGFGPIPWLMMGEILPGKIRGSAASVATAFNWACTFVMTLTFPGVMKSIGVGPTFFLLGAFCVTGLLFVLFFVPETKGKSLDEIENTITGKTRRTSCIANIKPLPNGC